MNIHYTVLTLTETPQRLKESLETLNNGGIYPKLFYGLNNNKTGLFSHFRVHSAGIIGCWVSHMMMWTNSRENDCDWFVFFEDDFKANQDTKSMIELTLSNVPDGYDFCFLNWWENRGGLSFIKPLNDFVSEQGNVWSLSCYAINKKSIDKLIKIYNSHPINHIDLDIAKRGIVGTVKVCYSNKIVGGLIDGAVSSITPPKTKRGL